MKKKCSLDHAYIVDKGVYEVCIQHLGYPNQMLLFWKLFNDDGTTQPKDSVEVVEIFNINDVIKVFQGFGFSKDAAVKHWNEFQSNLSKIQ